VKAKSFTVNSATRITAKSPAGTDPVDVTVITADGMSATSSADRFSYAPAVTRLSPTSGPLTGGTTVTITGTGFYGVTAVYFGWMVARFTVNSATQITATSPALNIRGTLDMTVVTVNGTSVTSSADRFTFTKTTAAAIVQPVSSISPAISLTWLANSGNQKKGPAIQTLDALLAECVV
jgi:hypothetical protein